MTKEEFKVLKEGKKYKYVVAAVVALLSLVLFLIGFFFCEVQLQHYIGKNQYEYKSFTLAQCFIDMNKPENSVYDGYMFIITLTTSLLLGFMLISLILRFVQAYTGFKFIKVFQVIVIFGILISGMLLAFLCYLFMYAAPWIVFGAGLIGGAGGFLVNGIIAAVLFIPEKTIEFFKKCLRFIAAITNFRYKGKAPISYFGKIMEVFVQIMLLPVSLFIELLFVPYSVIGFFYFGQLIIKKMFYLELKGEKDDRIEIRGEVEERVVKKTVEHDIRNIDGVKIGTYESVDDCVEYYGGDYVKDDQMKDAFKNGFAVLPLRIVSLLLSVIALLIPKMYIKVTRPKCEHKFKYSYFRYLDLIIFE